MAVDKDKDKAKTPIKCPKCGHPLMLVAKEVAIYKMPAMKGQDSEDALQELAQQKSDTYSFEYEHLDCENCFAMFEVRVDFYTDVLLDAGEQLTLAKHVRE
jgi:DNA-directed RNA polymerase subunit RPC12/RpoP